MDNRSSADPRTMESHQTPEELRVEPRNSETDYPKSSTFSAEPVETTIASSKNLVGPADSTRQTQSGMRGVARQTGLYGLGQIFGKALGFVLLPVYTRFLSPADYGVMELVGMTLDVVTIIAGAQLVGGIYRFYHKADNDHARRTVITSAYLLMGLSYGGLAILTIAIAPWLSDLIFGTERHANVLRLAAATVAVTPLLTVSQAYIRLRNEAGVFVLSNLGKLLIAAAINIVLLVVGWGVAAMFVSSLVATTLIGAGLAIRVVRSTGARVSRRAMADLLRYGMPLVATNIATFVLTFGDRYFLQVAAGETAVGLYSMAYQFGFLLLLLGFTPFMGVWQPRRFEIASRPDRDELYARGFIYLNAMLLPIGTAIILFVDDFFKLMTTPAFYPAAAYVPVIVCAYILQGWGNIQDIGILIKEKTIYLTVANGVAAGAAVLGYALLIPPYLAWGAAWATLATFIIRYVLIYSFSQRLWHVRYQWTPVLKMAGLSTVAVVLGMAIPPLPFAASVLLRAAIYAIYLIALLHAGILSEQDRHALGDRLVGALERLGRATRLTAS